MNQIYNNNIKGQTPRYSARDLKNLRILLENLAEGLGSKKEHCCSYVVSAFENTNKNLVVQGRVQLEHSSDIVKVTLMQIEKTLINDCLCVSKIS